MLKFSGSIIWRLGTRGSLRKYSSTGASLVMKDKINLTRNATDTIPKTSVEAKESPGLVAAAFASLNSPEDVDRKPSPKSVKQSRTQQIDSQILKASDVNSLLIVAEMPVVSRRHALKMVSILSEWSSGSKVQLADFEKDPRFLKLCRILARTPTSQAMSSLTMAEDLNTVLGITGDDEAARLITNLTLPQMIKVMKALNQKGRRSTPLLRALSHNITRQSDVIDLKKSADLLFSMAALNFPDPVLLDRICTDVIECLPSNDNKPAVVNSIIVSLGLMKYRHEPALSAITMWLQRHRSVCRAGDIASAVVTLATLDYLPAHTDGLLEAALSLKEEEMVRSSAWLDLVFSLLTLDKAEPHHLTSTLQTDFIDKLLSTGGLHEPLGHVSFTPIPHDRSTRRIGNKPGLVILLVRHGTLWGRPTFSSGLLQAADEDIPIPARRKLMMIDAYASLTVPGTPRLPEDISVGVPVMHTKEKQLYVHSIMDTFKSLVSAESFLKRNCNSGMGFLYDAEFAVDSRCHPVPLEKAAVDKSIHRIAVLGLDYHDMSRKVVAPLGVNQLYSRLLKLKGYSVLRVPYTEYNPKDKLVSRVQYIEKQLKNIVSDKAAS